MYLEANSIYVKGYVSFFHHTFHLGWTEHLHALIYFRNEVKYLRYLFSFFCLQMHDTLKYCHFLLPIPCTCIRKEFRLISANIQSNTFIYCDFDHLPTLSAGELSICRPSLVFLFQHNKILIILYILSIFRNI